MTMTFIYRLKQLTYHPVLRDASGAGVAVRFATAGIGGNLTNEDIVTIE